MRELTDDRAELSARLGHPRAGARRRGSRPGRSLDGEVVVERGCTGGPQDLAKLGLCPDGAEDAGARADDGCGLAAERVGRVGREAQSMAFFNCPGIDALYSGVANSRASASAIAARRTAIRGGGSTSSSS